MTKICISPGDPAGIGPEITLKALAENRKIQKKFVLLGDGNFYEGLIKKLNLDLKKKRALNELRHNWC